MKKIPESGRVLAILALFLFCFHGRAAAQRLFFLFAHGVYCAPVDTYFKHNYNYGGGVEAGAAFGTGRTFLLGTIGYTSFRTASGNKNGNIDFVPIKAGLRHYLLVGKLLFFQVDAGVAHVQNSLVYGSRFTGDLGLGMRLGAFEVLAVYDGYARSGEENAGYSSWFGLKAGFRLGL
jgi:hypothetical protein